MIDDEWRPSSFDELLSFRKERQKMKTWVFASVPQEGAFDLHFCQQNTADDEITAVPSSIARFYSLGANWTKNELSPARDEKKTNSFSRTYFQA
jgi:hypothetical protein